MLQGARGLVWPVVEGYSDVVVVFVGAPGEEFEFRDRGAVWLVVRGEG
jgi:hypothetical protein